MKTVHGFITLVLLGAGSVAAAQTYQQPATPPPDSSVANPDQMSGPDRSSTSGQTNAPSSAGGDTSASSASTKQQMKDCIAQQQASNSGMTKAQAKKACKHQANGSQD